MWSVHLSLFLFVWTARSDDSIVCPVLAPIISKSRCYFLSKKAENFLNAREICIENGGDLAYLSDKESGLDIKSIMWFPATRKSKQADWYFLNGSKLSAIHKDLTGTDPGTEDGMTCVIFTTDNRELMAVPCYHKADFACKFWPVKWKRLISRNEEEEKHLKEYFYKNDRHTFFREVSTRMNEVLLPCAKGETMIDPEKHSINEKRLLGELKKLRASLWLPSPKSKPSRFMCYVATLTPSPDLKLVRNYIPCSTVGRYLAICKAEAPKSKSGKKANVLIYGSVYFTIGTFFVIIKVGTIAEVVLAVFYYKSYQRLLRPKSQNRIY